MNFRFLMPLLVAFFITPALNAAEKQKNPDFSPPQVAVQFVDGKDFYTYKTPVAVNVPAGKLLIQYFYRYDCTVCLHADDYLKQYAARHPEVELVRTPSFADKSPVSSAFNATFAELGRPELSDQFLFDSEGRKASQSLMKEGEALSSWFVQQGVDEAKFLAVLKSEAVKNRVESDFATFKHYLSPNFAPVAVINGKYILLQNTLFNDDYTFAVLDFLREKITKQGE